MKHFNRIQKSEFVLTEIGRERSPCPEVILASQPRPCTSTSNRDTNPRRVEVNFSLIHEPARLLNVNQSFGGN